MTAMLTSAELAARTDRAVAAAVGAGRDLGLTVTAPRVLYDVFSVIVHLSPAPVAVRVPTVLPRTVAADPGRQVACQSSGVQSDRGPAAYRRWPRTLRGAVRPSR